MKGKIKLEVHYGEEVFVNTLTERLRGEECLCLNCGRLDKCPPAKAFYELCKRYHIALAVTRCGEWLQRQEDAP